ncbi:MAG: PxKF domain-containing protein [Terriglobales bacterium]
MKKTYFVLAAVCTAVCALFLLLPTRVQAASTTIVISQVYGGGGNSGATYKNDFIELYNLGSAPVDLTGWTVQYASATGSSWQKTTLSGVLQPGQYYLIQEAQGAGGTVSLPTPSAVGTIPMAAGAGKVALVNNSTTLTGTCPVPATAAVVDFVGFGSTANCFEGTGPTPAPSNTTAVLRAGAGATDTDSNSADFAAGAPNPRTSASGISASGVADPSPAGQGEGIVVKVLVTPGSNPPSTGLTAKADLSAIGGSSTQTLFDDGTNGDAIAGDNSFSYGIAVPAATPLGNVNIPVTVSDAQLRTATPTIVLNVIGPVPLLSVHDVQGSGASSPYAGQLVKTTGVVTGAKTNGYFIQAPDAEADGDPNTSEGVFVFTSSTPPAGAAVGNLVQVRGSVQEYVPASDAFSPSTTEFANSTLTVLASGQSLPAAVTITAADLDPHGSMTQLQKYEGMRVHVDTLSVTGPSNGSINESTAGATSNGAFWGVFPGTPRPYREAGIEAPGVPPAGSPANVPTFDGNPERLRVDTKGQVGSTPIDVTSFATVNNITGVLEYTFRSFSIVTDPGTPPAFSGNIGPAAVPAAAAHEVTVGSANLERFFDTTDDPDTQDAVVNLTGFNNRLAKYSLAIRTILQMPDILGVEEVEHLSTLQALATQINSDALAATGANPGYVAYLEEGNDIGGIDVGFLVKSSRIAVVDVTQLHKDTTYTDPNNGQQAMLNDRPPLLVHATVKVSGKELELPLTVIVNHLRSLSSIEDPADGDRVRAKRLAQAEDLAGIIHDEQIAHPNASIISVGDYNAYQTDKQDGYVDVVGTVMGTPAPPDQVVLAGPSGLVTPPLTDLVSILPPAQQYSYVFDGNMQVLDHILVNSLAYGKLSRFLYARNNADFPESYHGDPTRPERYSDHDVPVAYFTVAQDTTPPVLTLPSDMSVLAASAAGSVVTYTASATDTVDGPTTITCAPLSGATFPIGTTTVNCSSTDAHSNTATGSFHVNVGYAFSGFFSPLGGGAFNAGSTVPVKFQLGFAGGALVTSPGAVQGITAAYNADCAGAAEGTPFAAAPAGGSTLRYDLTASQFVFNWKTGSAFAGSCYNLNLNLSDGNSYSTMVSFK